MGKFKHLVATGVYILRAGARDYEAWSRLMLEEFGPSIYPFIIDLRVWSVAALSGDPSRLNCWDFMGCAIGAPDRACPAARACVLDGVHGGRNAGRLCWAVGGTLCGGAVQGSPEEKRRACRGCDFYRAVLREEGRDFVRAYLL